MINDDPVTIGLTRSVEILSEISYIQSERNRGNINLNPKEFYRQNITKLRDARSFLELAIEAMEARKDDVC